MRGPRRRQGLDRGASRSGGITVPRAKRFRDALEAAGGLYVAFGRFLAGRTDLLPAEHAQELAALDVPRLVRPRLRAGELGFPVTELKRIGHSYLSTRYLAATDDGPLLLEAFGATDDLPAREFRRLSRDLGKLTRGPEAAAGDPTTMEEFRVWLEAQGAVARRRELLASLDGGRDGRALALPRSSSLPMPSHVLAYVPLPGRSIATANDDGVPRLVPGIDREVVVESILETVLLFGVVPLDLDPRGWVECDDGRVGPCFAPALAVVPRNQLQTVAQYVCALVAEDLDRAVRAARRALTHPGEPGALRRHVLATLPDLRIQQDLPVTAASAENMWRAMRAAGHQRLPAYFRELHRVIVSAGEWTGGGGDPFAGSIWSVLGTLSRHHMARLGDERSVTDLALGSMLSAAAGVRAMGSWLEAAREDEAPIREGDRDRSPLPPRRSAPPAVLLVEVVALFVLLRLALGDPAGSGSLGAMLGAVAITLALFLQTGGGRR